MKKKYYIPLVWIGALLLFSILPVTNYITDQWRVLHKDYKTTYRGIAPNKTFLKIVYLLDHPKQYDTILMGSSRSGYMDAQRISPSAYNMKFNFALAGMHLHNLKTLLANKVQIKNLWLGINDYVIWKNPSDHELDYQRKLYKNNLWDQLNTYAFYLLKPIKSKDLKILKGGYQLYPTDELTNPDRGNIKTAKEREAYTLSHRKLWIEKMTNIKPTLLGYTDDKYRIDDAISEIKEIKKLCDENGIKLTPFIYPSFYKTYLSFNQYKIEEFKRKLSKVMDFYDFYALNAMALDEFKWQDSSHFHASVGSYIIKSIKDNKFLVTSANIETRIQETRAMHANLLEKDLPIKYIYTFNANIDLGILKSIFDLKNKDSKFYKNNHFTMEYEKDFIALDVNNSDPILILEPIKATSNNVILKCDMQSSKNAIFTIYYKTTTHTEYNETDAIRVKLHKGKNKFNMLIPSSYIENNIRIDVADKKGEYIINELSIFTLPKNM